MNSNPLVSILIPTFNRANYIGFALDSALSQTYRNIEIIVHDDASTDDTQNVLSKYRDPRLRIIRTKTNHSMIGGWNYIVKKAKGEYIKFLASDDLLEPSCVEDLVGIASKYPQAALITCTRKFVDNTGHIIKKMGFASRTERVGGIEHARWILTSIRQNLIGEPTAVMYPKRLVRLAGEYDARFSQFADFEYWIRLLAYGDLVYLHKPLCSFRVHASSNTSKAILDGRFITEIFTLINKYYKDPIFLNTFSLSEVDRAKVIKLKTLDTLKNIKDLMLNGHFSQSARYIAQLTSSLYNTFHA